MTTEEKLIKLYEQAEKRLKLIILQKGTYSTAANYQRSLLRQITKELEKLKAASGQMVQKLTEESYTEGLDELVGELQEQGVPMDEITGAASSSASSTSSEMVPMSEKPTAQLAMSGLNKSQIRVVAENTNYDFNRAIDLIGRRIDDNIREAAIEATAEKLTEGQTVRQMQKNVEQKLTSQNLTAVEYSNGSQMPLKSYAEMVSRSTTAEAQNVAKTTQGKAMGYDLVKMTTHSPTCPICAQYQGRVYAITKEAAEGKYKLDGVPLRFPYLYDTAFAGGYSTIHPNCRHRIAVFAIRAYTDEEIKRYVSLSNAPFEDTRSDQERKAYSAMVAKRRKQLENRRQYEKIKAALPDQAPKSFAAFVRMKAANSERYQNLMEDYRYISRAANSDIGTDARQVSPPDESSKYYKPVVLDESNPIHLVREHSDFTAYRCTNTSNPIYVSEGSKTIKRKVLHQIDAKKSEVLKLLGVSKHDNLPTVYVVSGDEMGINAAAAYRAADNALFIVGKYAIYKKDDVPEPVKGLAFADDVRSTYLHEMFHWMDAQLFRDTFGEITGDNRGDCEKFVQLRAKKNLDKLQATGHNVFVSTYAIQSYRAGLYDEVYAEYRVSEVLGGD